MKSKARALFVVLAGMITFTVGFVSVVAGDRAAIVVAALIVSCCTVSVAIVSAIVE